MSFKKLKSTLGKYKTKRQMKVTVRFYIGKYDDDRNQELPLNVLNSAEHIRFKHEVEDFNSSFPHTVSVTQGGVSEHATYFETTLTTPDKDTLIEWLNIIDDKSIWQSPAFQHGDKYHFVRIKWH